VSEPDELVLSATPDGAVAKTNGVAPDEVVPGIPVPPEFTPATLK
jgi:hypothetical protein